MIKLYGEVNTIAETDATVRLLGETGVGKDVIARRIHALSLRKNKTFIKVDCGASPKILLKPSCSAMRRARFSGASKTGKIGLIESGGGRHAVPRPTKSGSCPCPCRRGCSGSFPGLGDHAWVPPRRSRSTSASSPPPTRISNAPSHAGKFRSDLYYRLKVAVIARRCATVRRTFCPRTHVPAVLRQQSTIVS